MDPEREKDDDHLTERHAGQESPQFMSTTREPLSLRRRDVIDLDFLLVRDDH